MNNRRLTPTLLVVVTILVLMGAMIPDSHVSVYASKNIALSFQVKPASLIVASSSSVPNCSPSGLCPSMLDNAYGFQYLHSEGIVGKGQTVVIVDACGDPNIASDIQTYDNQFHLPAAKLTVIYPQGTKKLCVDGSWALETALDVEMAHTVAPRAAID